MIIKSILFISYQIVLWINYQFILAILFEEKFKVYLKILEQDYYDILRERRIIAHLMGVSILLPKTLALFILGVTIYLYFKPYIKAKRLVNSHQEQLHYEFPIWIRSIQCHLQSSNVVVSIEKSYEYAPQLLKHHLKDLIWKLSCEPHNLEHYESFMAQYENIEIEKMMKFLYRFNHMDAKTGEKHLDRMIESTGLWLKESRMKKQEEVLNRFSMFGILPVVVVSVYFLIMMSMVILSMMEGGWML